MVRKTFSQRNNIHKEMLKASLLRQRRRFQKLCMARRILTSDSLIPDSTFSPHLAPNLPHLNTCPLPPQTTSVPLPILLPPPSCQSGCEILDPLQLHDVELLVSVPCVAAVLENRSHQHLIQVRQTTLVCKPETLIEKPSDFFAFQQTLAPSALKKLKRVMHTVVQQFVTSTINTPTVTVYITSFSSYSELVRGL